MYIYSNVGKIHEEENQRNVYKTVDKTEWRNIIEPQKLLEVKILAKHKESINIWKTANMNIKQKLKICIILEPSMQATAIPSLDTPVPIRTQK